MMTRHEVQIRLDELERELVAVETRRTDLLQETGKLREALSDREQAAQRPFDHRVIVRETEFEPPPAMRESVGWTIQQYFDCLVTDPARNDLIVADVLRALGQGRPRSSSPSGRPMPTHWPRAWANIARTSSRSRADRA